jgi:hypothetical protein
MSEFIELESTRLSHLEQIKQIIAQHARSSGEKQERSKQLQRLEQAPLQASCIGQVSQQSWGTSEMELIGV